MTISKKVALLAMSGLTVLALACNPKKDESKSPSGDGEGVEAEVSTEAHLTGSPASTSGKLRLRLLIDGVPEAEVGLRSVDLEGFSIQTLSYDTKTERAFAPGATNFGNLVIRAEDKNKALLNWFKAAIPNPAANKRNISLIFLKETGPQTARSYNFLATSPISYEVLWCNSSQDSCVADIKFKIGSTVFRPRGETPPIALTSEDPAVAALWHRETRTVKVEIEVGGGNAIDTGWGVKGSFNMLARNILRDQRYKWARNESDLVSLQRGLGAGDGDGLIRWLDEAAANRAWQRGVTFTEQVTRNGKTVDGRKITCAAGQAFPAGYELPKLQFAQFVTNVVEVVKIKPLKCEVK